VAARNALITIPERELGLQVIAATATIADAAGHLSALTGMTFFEVGANLDGSPQADRLCVHLAAPLNEEMSIASDLQVRLLNEATDGGFITFVDSRKAVEVLAMTSNRRALGGLVANPA